MVIKTLLSLIPLPVLAAAPTNVTELVERLKSQILSPLISLLFVLATVFFLWGVIQYSLLAESDEKIATARNQMLWGIIGLTVMSAAWGIVKIICATFEVPNCIL